MDSHSTQTAGTPSAELDDVIDAVAREMTEGEPSGALRARVLERIEQGRRRSPIIVPRWAWAGAATATLILAVAAAVWMTGPVPGSRDARPTVAEQRSGSPSLSPAGIEAQARQPADVAPEAAAASIRLAAGPRPGRGAVSRGAQAAEVNAAEVAHAVPALAEIAPLQFSTVGPGPLEIAAVEVAPLPAMTSIDIASLDPGSNDTQSADPNKEK